MNQECVSVTWTKDWDSTVNSEGVFFVLPVSLLQYRIQVEAGNVFTLTVGFENAHQSVIGVYDTLQEAQMYAGYFHTLLSGYVRESMPARLELMIAFMNKQNAERAIAAGRTEQVTRYAYKEL